MYNGITQVCNAYKSMMSPLYCRLQCTVVGVVFKDLHGATMM